MDFHPDKNTPVQTKPKLRLVGGESGAARTPVRREGPLAPPRRTPPAGSTRTRPASAPQVTTPLPANDPRWVLALRVAESLQGTTLPPERRRKLIRMGRTFGLTEFDANLIIAIVQDQARRGHRAEVCPRMGEAQLRMVNAPLSRSFLGATPVQRWATVGLCVVALMALELCVLWLLLR